MDTKTQPLSEEENQKRTIVTIILLFLLPPIGWFLMIFWAKWPVWVKVLITVVGLILFGLLLLPLLAVILIAINPARQLTKANDTMRITGIKYIQEAVATYKTENNEKLPAPLNKPGTYKISSNGTGQKFCEEIVPKYLAALPVDPLLPSKNQYQTSDCANYDTGYTITVAKDGTFTVDAKFELVSPTPEPEE